MHADSTELTQWVILKRNKQIKLKEEIKNERKKRKKEKERERKDMKLEGSGFS